MQKIMRWVPIYIRGKEGFKEAVAAKLQMSWLPGSTVGETNLLMFWLQNRDELRDLKKAIGSKLIFKFRMHFITDLNGHLSHSNKKSVLFSDVENELIFKAIKTQDLILKNSAARVIVRNNNFIS